MFHIRNMADDSLTGGRYRSLAGAYNALCNRIERHNGIVIRTDSRRDIITVVARVYGSDAMYMIEPAP